MLLEIDHIIPLSKGGQTTENNLQTLCWKCNRNKGSKIIDYNNYSSYEKVDNKNIEQNQNSNDVESNNGNPKDNELVKEANKEDDLYNKIIEYKQLLDDGVISKEEFEKIKQKLIK